MAWAARPNSIAPRESQLTTRATFMSWISGMTRFAKSQRREWSPIAGVAGVQGIADGTNAFARFNFAEKFAYFSREIATVVSVPIFCGLAVDNGGSLYVVDSGNCRIRQLTMRGTNWVVSTIAGWVQGYADGQGTNAQFWSPSGIAVDANTNLYVSDTDSFGAPTNSPGYSVRVIRPSGSNWTVSTLRFTLSSGTGVNYGPPMSGVAVDSLEMCTRP